MLLYNHAELEIDKSLYVQCMKVGMERKILWRYKYMYAKFSFKSGVVSRFIQTGDMYIIEIVLA